MGRGALATATAALLVSAVAGCGGERQDANEPSGSYKVHVESASFPSAQHVAQRATMRIRVRNADSRDLPAVSVTVATLAPGSGPSARAAFTSAVPDPRLADPQRPIWVLDSGPRGGDTADTDTWSLGRLRAGQARTFEWHLTAVRAGRYVVGYTVSPGLDGKARAAGGAPRGAFDVTIAREPVPARVDDKGNVVRGEEAGRPGT